MNIFVVNRDPVLAARALPDQHVVKMPLESAQMLSELLTRIGVWSSWRLGAEHARHPAFLWLLEDEPERRGWLLVHALELCEEHRRRFPGSAPMKSLGVLRLADHALRRRGMASDGEPSRFAEAFRAEFPADAHRVLLSRRGTTGAEATIAMYRAYMDHKRMLWERSGHPMRFNRSTLQPGVVPWRG